MSKTASPGQEFEAEVASFFRAAGFNVAVNAKTAKPRQTDLFAKGDTFDLLVEAKNRKRKVDVSDIDNLRARLSEWANFEYIGQRWTFRHRLKKPLALDVLGTALHVALRTRATPGGRPVRTVQDPA